MCKLLLVSLIFLVACATSQKKEEAVSAAETPKEFARGEVILATQLLTNIFDEEMAPLSCVANHGEAELLLRTIHPRMEVIQDDLEALLDTPAEVSQLIQTCHSNCTCDYIDELFREHQVPLTRAQKKLMDGKNTKKELSRCMSYVQNTFCQSDLYKTLDKEKSDFIYEEDET